MSQTPQRLIFEKETEPSPSRGGNRNRGTNVSKTELAFGGGIAVLGILILIGVTSELRHDQGKQATLTFAPAETAIVRSTWYCSPGSKWAAEELAIATAHKDMAAIAGQIARNGAFELQAGTRVRVIDAQAGGLSLVRVKSGFHDGQECWFPSNLIQ